MLVLDGEPSDGLLMFGAFFDASGVPHAGQVLVVAGFLADRTQWLNFHKIWKTALDKASLEYFRMSEFTASQGSISRLERSD